MLYLEKYKNFKIYKNVKIINGISKSKNNKKNTAILHIGNYPEDITQFSILNPTLFRALYTPKRSRMEGIHKIPLLKQKEHYDFVRSNSPNYTIFKRKLQEYRKRNVVYDLTPEMNFMSSKIKYKGLRKLETVCDFILLKKQELVDCGYDKIAIAVPVDSKLLFNDFNKAMRLNNLDSSFSYFFNIFKKNLIKKDKIVRDLFDNVEIIFYVPNQNTFFKFSLKSMEERNKNNLHIVKLLRTSVKINNKLNLTIEEEEDTDNITEEDEKEETVEDKVEKKTQKITKSLLKTLNVQPENALGSSSTVELTDKIEETISKTISEKKIEDKKEIEIIEELDKNTELKEYLNDLKNLKKNGKDIQKRINNNKKLTQKQSDITIDDMSIKDIIVDYKSVSIDENEIMTKNSNSKIINDSVKKSKLKDFDNSYIKKQYKKDMASVLASFNNDPDIPLFITDIKKEDTSNYLNKKFTYTMTFKDELNNKHTMVIDIPKLKDGRFLFLNGGKKQLLKQIMLLPIAKTKPDTVQITTNYNKTFITRFGRKLSNNTENFKKILIENLEAYKIDKKLKVKMGDARTINNDYNVSLEYTEISSYLLRITNSKYTIIFDQSDIVEMRNENDIKYDSKLAEINLEKNEACIGFTNDKKYLIVTDGLNVYIKNNKEKSKPFKSIIDFIVSEILSQSLKINVDELMSKYKRSKSLAYTRMELNNKSVPLIILLSFELGLSNVLERYNIKYTIEKKNRKPSRNENVIKFKDCYIFYESSVRNSLLLSGLRNLPEGYNLDEFNKKEVYLDAFYEMYGSRNAAKGFHNTLTLMSQDPITKSVLKELSLPENIYDLLLYANTLLEDSSYSKLNNMKSYRIRGAEQINGYLYKILADSFKIYKDTLKAGSPKKISVPQDILIKKLLESQTVDEASTLNPSLEMEKMGGSTFKGLSGTNMNDAYTPEMRAFDSTMKGIFAMNSPDSDKIGVVRQLTYNPNIKNTRGMLETEADDLNTGLFSPAELMNPFTSRHSDPPRIGMQVTQQKHVIPVKEQNRPLFGSGVERTIPYLTSDFTFKAKKNGKVEKIDKEKQLVVLQYDDGTKDVIDVADTIAKNSNGGFFIRNKKELIVKEGEKFDKGDILAKHPNYFQGTDKNDLMYTTGRLCKVALTSADYTYEDSSIITNKLTKAMSTKVVMKKDIVLGAGATIEKMVKVGDKVKTGEPILIFENSFEDSSLNDLLDKLGNDFNETIKDLSKNILKSKYTGEVVDIQLYYNKDLEEFSPSIQKILKKYINKGKAKKKIVESIVSEEDSVTVELPPIEKQTDEKIKGNVVDGILIEIYIEYEDDLSVGDKITYYCALKTIISDVIAKDEEPYSEYRPDEPIDAILSPLSIISRMTTDIYNAGYLNKVLIELKRKVAELYKK